LLLSLLVLLGACSSNNSTSNKNANSGVATVAAPAATSPRPVIAVASPTAAARTATAAPASSPAAARPKLSNPTLLLATTTSTQDSGLLDVLIPLFEQQTGYQVKTQAVGSGQALALGTMGEADVLLVHSPAAELDFMAKDQGVNRRLVMHNDFIIVGDAGDPAHIKGMTSALDALKAIAAAKAPFISRGDNSGTNALELQLWKQAGIDPKGQSWYSETGQGMGATLTVTAEKKAYTISDRATYLATLKQTQLPLLLEKDPVLLNIYHVIQVNPANHKGLNVEGAQAFSYFMVAPETQKVIAAFGVDKYGQQLFIADAGKNEADLQKPGG
jgi:tungstate transport system substrate-binding protein